MLKKAVGLSFLLVFLFISFSVSLQADIYIKQVRKTDPFTIMGQTQPEKIETTSAWYGNNRIRLDTAEGATFIVLGDKNIVYIINHQDKVYAEAAIDGDVIGAMIGEGEEEDQEAREMMKMMAESFMDSIKAKVTATGETQKIKNWNARKYLLEMDMGQMGKSVAEIWATEDIKIPARLYHLAATAMLSQQPGMEKLMEEMKKIKGVVILQETTGEIMGAKIRTVEEVVELAEKAPPAGLYEVPKEYTRKK